MAPADPLPPVRPVRFDVAPAAGGRPCFYVGRTPDAWPGGVWVVDAGVRRLPWRARWSRVAPAWGPHAGAGGPELAAALLLDHAGVRVARTTARSFATDILEQLPAHGFVLTRDDLRLWLDVADCGRRSGLRRLRRP